MSKRTVPNELKKCREDFFYFAETYLWIVSKDAKRVRLLPNKAQREIIQGFHRHPHQLLLKARQLGSTTGIAAYFFWKILFHKNHFHH